MAQDVAGEPLRVSRREYAEVCAEIVFPHGERRDLFARILDRELSQNYSRDGSQKKVSEVRR